MYIYRLSSGDFINLTAYHFIRPVVGDDGEIVELRLYADLSTYNDTTYYLGIADKEDVKGILEVYEAFADFQKSIFIDNGPTHTLN